MGKKIILSLFLISITVMGATSAKATITASTTKIVHQFTESSEGNSAVISWNQSSNDSIAEYVRRTKNETERSRGNASTSFLGT